MDQEQEHEQEQEQEEEKEQEIEIEKVVNMQYQRTDESAVPWRFSDILSLKQVACPGTCMLHVRHFPHLQ
jgi:hypothetical protein